MLLLLATGLSMLAGIVIVFWGQDKRVKLWFFILCLGGALVTLGIYIEINYREFAFLAARINMTAALLGASAALLCARTMCGLPLHLPIIILLATASVVNLVTVWITDWYFTGKLLEYPWGIYVAGRIEFVANPVLVTMIGLYALVNLAVNFRKAHPLDKNRTGFLFLAYFFLSLSLLDYLPHFNLDLFNGPISGFSFPAFIGTFGYAILRYRLIEFRVFLGRTVGIILTGFIMAIVFTIFHNFTQRTNLDATTNGIILTILMVAIYAFIGTKLPSVMEKAVRRREPDYQAVIEAFSNDLTALWEEYILLQKTNSVCASIFNSPNVRFIEGESLLDQLPFPPESLRQKVFETEILRRSYNLNGFFLPDDELIVPISHGEIMGGALILGRRPDGKMYTRFALQALRMLGNIFSLALAKVRSASELKKRHELDRFLAPQVVERVLQGDTESINRKHRVIVTIFFSDLTGFTEMADKLDPDDVAAILNEYLSEMAEIAFQHGGTVDKFIGDSVMVFFGAPVGTDPSDQAQHCVSMAVSMQNRITQLNTMWLEKSLLSKALTCRIGIHTGEATVGSFGSHSRVDYTAIGSSVNLASRLEGKCAPGKILISEETYKLIQHKFQINSGTFIEVKGIERAIMAYEIDPELQT